MGRAAAAILGHEEEGSSRKDGGPTGQKGHGFLVRVGPPHWPSTALRASKSHELPALLKQSLSFESFFCCCYSGQGCTLTDRCSLISEVVTGTFPENNILARWLHICQIKSVLSIPGKWQEQRKMAV